LLFACEVTTMPLVIQRSRCCCPKLETKIVLTCFVATMATIFRNPRLFCRCHQLGCHGN
jgi:hypothetical protein